MNHKHACQAVCGLAFLPALLLLTSGVAHAGSFSVNPVRITLSAKQPVAALTVRNSSSEPTVVQLETNAWSQSMGQDLLIPSSDLLATPPIFTIQPGSTQILRVGLRKMPQASSEITYRLILREVPPSLPTSGLTVALRISMPVFVLPATATAADVKWHATRGKDGNIRVRATNNGTAHVQIASLSLESEGKPLGNRSVAEYVLPGNSRDWLVSAPTQPGAAAKLRIVAKTDSGTLNAEVALDAEAVAANDSAPPAVAAR